MLFADLSLDPLADCFALLSGARAEALPILVREPERARATFDARGRSSDDGAALNGRVFARASSLAFFYGLFHFPSALAMAAREVAWAILPSPPLFLM